MADRFAARQCAKYTVISLSPDWCKTPHRKGKPLPYTISIDLSGSAGLSSNVNFNGNPAFLHNQSDTVSVKGDAPGQGKGILSGTVGAKGEPITHSPTVRINQKPLVRENDLFWMNNKNTLGKLTARESGSAAHITDTGRIAGETAPDLWDDLQAQLEKGAAWIEKQQQDFADTFQDTLQEEFKAPIETAQEIWNDPQAYAQKQLNAARFQTDPAGAVAEYVQDKKDELAILKTTLGDTISELGRDIADWAGEFGDKLGDAWDIAQQGDLGKAAGLLASTTVSAGVDVINPGKKAQAAGEMASALGSAAKKAAIRKKQKMAAQKKADDKGNSGGGGGDQKGGGKSKGEGKQCGDPNKNKGDCAERLVEKKYKAKGYESFEASQLRNNSGHGLDHIFHNPKKGEVLVVETKSNRAGLNAGQKKGGRRYLEEQLEAMTKGVDEGKGRWKKYKGDAKFGKALKALNRILKSGNKQDFTVCRVKLADDPTGCYGKGGRGTCKPKPGTKITCKPWQ